MDQIAQDTGHIVSMPASTVGSTPAHATQASKMRVFYGFDPIRPIDIINPGDTSKDPKGRYSGKTLAALRQEYGRVEVGDGETVMDLQNKAYSTLPARVTQRAFYEALESMPPMDRTTTAAGETFKLSEYKVAYVTTIYARVAGSYWSMVQHHGMLHDEIVAMTRAAIERERAAAGVTCTAPMPAQEP